MLRPLLTLVELYAGIGSMSQAASCLGIAAELQAFTELPTPAADYLSTVHGAPNLGPTEHADYTGLNPVITTVTCECTPFTESGLQRFADDPRSAQILQSAEAILALRPRILIKENVRHFYSMDDNPRHGLFTHCVIRPMDAVTLGDLFFAMRCTPRGACCRACEPVSLLHDNMRHHCVHRFASFCGTTPSDHTLRPPARLVKGPNRPYDRLGNARCRKAGVCKYRFAMALRRWR